MFLPTSSWYVKFNLFLAYLSIFNALQWPYVVAFGFPDNIFDWQFIILYIGELFDLINILLTFFQAYKDETTKFETNYEKI